MNVLLLLLLVPTTQSPVEFARDIQPILADKCFACHGPDSAARKGGLRLDSRDAILKSRRGKTPIVPGDPDAGELMKRLRSNGDDRMPPKDSDKQLTPREIDLIRGWIAQGAKWEDHWAFIAPKSPAIPSLYSSWQRNPIDAFVFDTMRKQGFEPNPEADRHTLVRRLSFDLTGLPPTKDEVAAFVNDISPDAYERMVLRLLKSPHFGERMAMDWLDVARYSDTDGFQADETRTNWPWRDWVIDAFNRNMPFDQFTRDQFAGDLLPVPTPEQRLATCFHRNHMTNGEGGRDPEESRVDYVLDRVNTTGTVWLGLTLGCCQCHSHKFDPFSQKEYYQLTAFFNSIDEDGKAGRAAKPYFKARSPHGARALHTAERELSLEMERLAQAENRARAGFAAWLLHKRDRYPADYSAWKPIVVTKLEATDGTVLIAESENKIRATGPDPHHEDYRVSGTTPLRTITGMQLTVFPDSANAHGGFSRSQDGQIMLANLKVTIRHRARSVIREIAIATASADYSGLKIADKAYGPIADVLDDDPRTGWSTLGSDLKTPRIAVFGFREPVSISIDEEVVVELQQRALEGRYNIGLFRIAVTDERGPTIQGVKASPLESYLQTRPVNAPASPNLVEQFLAEQAEVMEARERVVRGKQKLADAKKAAGDIDVMVLADRKKPRPTHLLIRGAWDQHGETVSPGVPTALAPFPSREPFNRLGLARWLTDRHNPLTARVAVNRLWQMIHGSGLVRTPDDFGLQGERPTHPELLDWLAVEFMESGWDVKRLLHMMVTSATYRQSSGISTSHLSRDPENRLWSRAARYRLPSWMIRDASLQVSGLLTPDLGGPPVFPYQPDGVWEENTMGRFKYPVSTGIDRYRRTTYAFWRRSSAPTFLLDAAQRRVCEVRAMRTNTPLHALALLNDRTIWEASLALGSRVACGNANKECTELFVRILSRPPSPSELAVVGKMLAVAKAQRPTVPPLAVVAQTLMNLDEAQTRE